MPRNLILSQYVGRRNGVALGARGALTAMLRRSFGADSFAGFWRYWNPIWGYFLGRYVHVPLRRVLPNWLALVGTFAVSGALHDLAIWGVAGSPTLLLTSWFTVLGLVVLTSKWEIRYPLEAWMARAAVHGAILAGTYWVASWARGVLGLG